MNSRKTYFVVALIIALTALLFFIDLKRSPYGMRKKEQRVSKELYYDTVLFAGKKSEEIEKYSITGTVRGDASFVYFSDAISVTYTALNNIASETGDLLDLHLEEGSGLKNVYSDYSIQGVWRSRVAGSGSFYIVPDNGANALGVYIIGENWMHTIRYYLDNDSMEIILNRFNQAWDVLH